MSNKNKGNNRRSPKNELILLKGASVKETLGLLEEEQESPEEQEFLNEYTSDYYEAYKEEVSEEADDFYEEEDYSSYFEEVLRWDGDRPIYHEQQILSVDELKPGDRFIEVTCGSPSDVLTFLRTEEYDLGLKVIYRTRYGIGGSYASDVSLEPYGPGDWNPSNHLVRVQD